MWTFGTSKSLMLCRQTMKSRGSKAARHEWSSEVGSFRCRWRVGVTGSSHDPSAATIAKNCGIWLVAKAQTQVRCNLQPQYLRHRVPQTQNPRLLESQSATRRCYPAAEQRSPEGHQRVRARVSRLPSALAISDQSMRSHRVVQALSRRTSMASARMLGSSSRCSSLSSCTILLTAGCRWLYADMTENANEGETPRALSASGASFRGQQLAAAACQHASNVASLRPHRPSCCCESPGE